MKQALRLFLIINLLTWVTLSSAGTPLWTFTPLTTTTLSLVTTATDTIQYQVTNQSSKAKNLKLLPTFGLTQTSSCYLMPKGQAGSSCILTLLVDGSTLPKKGLHQGPSLCQSNTDGSPNPNQCYQPNAADVLNITRLEAPEALLTVLPNSLIFAVNSTADVTITNTSTTAAAIDVLATVPNGSNITIQNTTCAPSLAPGGSCVITFTANVVEGPTVVPIAGNNTNIVNVSVTVVNQPIIAITAPAQATRLIAVGAAGVSLTVTNDVTSPIAANNITLSDSSNCPNVVVDDSNCISVAPGASCTLDLTSPSPYIPCTITISGSNTANSPTSIIGFTLLGGIVVEESGGSGKIIRQPLIGATSRWTLNFTDIAGAVDLDDGISNTNAIVADSACSNDPADCAAQHCRDFGAVWYLPAINELAASTTILCPGGVCTFGGPIGIVWSSTQFDINIANAQPFPSGSATGFKNDPGFTVNCFRTF